MLSSQDNGSQSHVASVSSSMLSLPGSKPQPKKQPHRKSLGSSTELSAVIQQVQKAQDCGSAVSGGTDRSMGKAGLGEGKHGGMGQALQPIRESDETGSVPGMKHSAVSTFSMQHKHREVCKLTVFVHKGICKTSSLIRPPSIAKKVWSHIREVTFGEREYIHQSSGTDLYLLILKWVASV